MSLPRPVTIFLAAALGAATTLLHPPAVVELHASPVGHAASAPPPAPAAPRLSPEAVQETFVQATQAHGQGRLEEASELYEKVIANDAYNVLAHFNLGMVHGTRGNFSAALAEFKATVQIKGDYDRAWLMAGHALEKLERKEEALVMYGQAGAPHQKARLLTTLGRADEARRVFDDMLADGGVLTVNEDVLVDAAVAYIAVFRYEETVAMLEARKDTLQTAAAWTNLALAKFWLRDSDGAAEAARRAIGLDAGNVNAMIMLASIVKESDKDEAKQLLMRVLELDSSQARAAQLLAALESNENLYLISAGAIRREYDALAVGYDEHQGKAHRALADDMRELLETARSGMSDLNILDAGMGTGAAGPAFKSLKSTMVGLDHSPGMLAVAKFNAKKLPYDERVMANLALDDVAEDEDLLEATPEGGFDLVLAADVLPHFGADTAAVIGRLAAMTHGGESAMLLFSAHVLPESDPLQTRLQPDDRYAHSDSYIRAALAANGFPRVAIHSSPAVSSGGAPSTIYFAIKSLRDGDVVDEEKNEDDA